MQRTELSETGEFGLIKHLASHLKPKSESTVKGIGDDAAVLKSDGKKYQLLCTDILMEGIHFDLSYAPLKHLGYKSVIVNLSDIYAMNGKATHIVVSVALSNRFSLEAVEELYAGIILAAEKYGVDVVGGDTSSSRSGLVINVAAYGEVIPEKVTYRNGASDKELLVVSGDLGAAYMGLQILEREKAVYQSNPDIQPDLEGNDYILERQLKPEARRDVVDILDQLNIVPTSMIDVSDGLASEVLHLCEESGVGAMVYEEKIPIDPTVISAAEDFNLDPTMCAMNGGEDYELLFTIRQDDFDKLKGNPHFTVIGHMVSGSDAMLISRDGSAHPIQAQGWDALRARKEG